MRTVLAGIDEAGWGPTLGPFCVGQAVLSLPGVGEGPAPDLWDVLADGVCREPGRAGATDRRGRVPIADSKALKLSNSVKSVHPLVHLERGVLAFERLRRGELPASDDGLLEALGVEQSRPAWYSGEAQRLPLSMTAGEANLSAARVEATATRAGVRVEDIRVDVTWEPGFNEAVRERGNKADAALAALCRHLRRLWAQWAGTHDDAGMPQRLGIACDRLGGRVAYADVLALMLPDATIETLEEAPARSRYMLTRAGESPRRAGIVFLSEGESAHLPVALASMAAKYVREVLMARFNRHWGAAYRDLAGGELKPTAGYALDARRWLEDMKDVLTPAQRRALVRIA
ncbi:MAG: hypothetical protein HBSAPP03_22450 [Phycisphaerae bacterium]|nr:MAG: hypothetical protein HBSAPP03_22450 [Phycisphaerae bacterium]